MFCELYCIGNINESVDIEEKKNIRDNSSATKKFRIFIRLRPLPENSQKNSKDISDFFEIYDHIFTIKNKKGKNEYFLNLNNDFFTLLSQSNNNFLDDLLKLCYIDNFNHNMWWDYCRNKNIYKYYENKGYQCSLPKKEILKLVGYNYDSNYDDIELYTSISEDYELYEKIKHKNENILIKYNIVGDVIKSRVNNIEELIITLFDAIFYHTEFKFKIKKCRNCGHYFITTHNGNKCCDRIFKNKMTCAEYNKKIQATYFYDTPIKKFEKRCKDLYNKKRKENDKKTFREYKLNLMEKCKNDTNKYVYTLLENIYRTNETKLAVIEQLGLQKYLEKDYINNLKK